MNWLSWVETSKMDHKKMVFLTHYALQYCAIKPTRYSGYFSSFHSYVNLFFICEETELFLLDILSQWQSYWLSYYLWKTNVNFFFNLPGMVAMGKTCKCALYSRRPVSGNFKILVSKSCSSNLVFVLISYFVLVFSILSFVRDPLSSILCMYW